MINEKIILQFLKNGSGIHIKESKKGSFTKYCNGKVTDECIRRGKNSPSAAIRKKATFAANVRKWHHKDGGLIMKALEGNTLMLLDNGRQAYRDWENLGFINLMKRRFDISGLFLLQAPSILNLSSAVSALFGGYDPKNPDLVTGEAPVPGRTGSIRAFELSKNASKGERIWKQLFDYVKSHPQVVSKPPVPLGLIKGTEYTPQVIQPLEGLSVRQITPLKLSNPVTNPAERQAALDWMAENPGFKINTKLPTGRPAGDYRYPKNVVKPLLTLQIESKTPTNKSSEVYHDKHLYSKALRTKDKNARAMEYKKATITNSGRSRVHESLDRNDWETLGKYKEYAKRLYKILERLNKFPKGSKEYKQAFDDRKSLLEEYRNKYRFQTGGIISFALEGTKFDWVGLGTNLLKTYTQNKKISNDIEAKVAELQAEWADVKKKLIDESIKKLNLDFQLWMADYQSGAILDLPSLIVSSNRAWKDYSLKLMSGEQDINNKIALLKASLLQSDNWSNFLLESLGQVGNYLSNKISTPTSTTSNTTSNTTSLTPPLFSYTTMKYVSKPTIQTMKNNTKNLKYENYLQ